ncbi:MAG TPA: gliding motility protein GldM [Flavobacteriaceae bacterium]|nr:gliding motility protein GldM [Flavobacteriaceae bacterium]
MSASKLTPRQRMINLMYLVFIAMMALNMTKEVLSAFGIMDERLTEANETTMQRNSAFMSNLAQRASESPEQYGAIKEASEEMQTISNDFIDYVQGIKDEIIGSLERPEDYETQDQSGFTDRKFFVSGKLTDEGQEFVDKVDTYRTDMKALLQDAPQLQDIIDDIDKKFSTEDVETRDGLTRHWLNYNFEGFPLIATRTKLTQMQSDVMNIQSEILAKMLSGSQDDALSYDNYATLLETSKSAYYTGEEFEGSLVLGRTDDATSPARVELTLNGRPLSEDQYEVKGGKINLKVNAGTPGENLIEGKLVYMFGGEEQEVEVKQSFTTISRPTDAVISADKMNVVYRGVENPLTIAIPGLPDNSVNASGAGLTKVSGSKYVMRPGAGREVVISASGTTPDGVTVSSKVPFRIKDIPRPTGTVRGEDGNGGAVRIERQGLEISTIGAVLLDFDFDLNLQVSGFSFRVPGQPTINVQGNKLNQQAKQALQRAPRGSVVQIIDIKANISGNSSYKLPRISPIMVELTN